MNTWKGFAAFVAILFVLWFITFFMFAEFGSILSGVISVCLAIALSIVVIFSKEWLQ